MATSSLEVWDDKQNHSACRVRGNRTTPRQDQRRDRSPGPAATRQPGRAADPLRQHWLPLPRRPAAAPRALPDLDPQGRQQDRHPHPGHHPGQRPAPADGELPPTTRTHHGTRDPRTPAGQRRPDPARPLTGLSARALTPWFAATRRSERSWGAGQRWARSTASAVRPWIPAKSPALTRSRGTIHEPPTAATEGMARYSARFFGPTPPVGTNRTSPKGAASALIAPAPPEVPAGKNFTVVMPSSSAAWTSVAVTAPGNASTPSSWQRSTTVRDRPGETTKLAPAATAWSTCAGVTTVPAPTRMSPRAAIARMESAAAAVRKVTSATGSPPATRAPARALASPASSSTTTGTRRAALSADKTSMGYPSL